MLYVRGSTTTFQGHEALDLAPRLDRSKTALFMMLLLRQHDRGQALRRWVDVYLTGLQPLDLPPDFRVVIDGVAGGALGDGSAPRLSEWMSSRYLAETRGFDARLEARKEWKQQLTSMVPVEEAAPTLKQSCRGWPSLRERHDANVMIEAVERHFRARFDADADAPADLTDRMLHRERALEDAVSKPGTGSRRSGNSFLRHVTAPASGTSSSWFPGPLSPGRWTPAPPEDRQELGPRGGTPSLG